MGHNIICGDCYELIKRVPDNSVDLVVTDPPYDIKAINGGGTVNNLKKMNKSLERMRDDIPNITQSYDIEKFAKEVYRVQGGVNAYFWCNKAQIPEYFRVYVQDMGCKFDILCWHKTNALPTYHNKYLSDTEYCLHFFKGKGTTFPESYEDAKTFWFEPINAKDKKEWQHPTIKPLEFIKKLVRNSSKEGGDRPRPVYGEWHHRSRVLLASQKLHRLRDRPEVF